MASEPKGAADRRVQIAALVSVLPILFGIGFAIYAFTIGTLTKITFTEEVALSSKETIVEAGGSAAVVLAFTPLVLAVFVAILLHLARRDNDTAPLIMAWAFSGFIAIVSAVSVTSLGRFFVAPALLLLVAAGATQFVVSTPRD